MNMKQYEIFELQYKGEEPQGSHVAVDLSATFTIDGEMKTVRGFYAGNGSYVIRFLPEKTGSYVYHVSGCITDDGEVVCTAAFPLYPASPIRTPITPAPTAAPILDITLCAQEIVPSLRVPFFHSP